MYAFADLDFKYKVANMFADYMLKVQTEICLIMLCYRMRPLQKENKAFEEGNNGFLETIKS